VPLHALEYAYGTKFYKGSADNRLRPRWRKDGKAERPYAGKVYISLHPVKNYDEKGPLDVPSLSKNGEISAAVTNNILHERECTFPAWIKGKYVVNQHVARFPSFKKDYKEIYLYKYGLTEQLYILFKAAINSSPPHSTANKDYKLLLSAWLCCYHEVRIIEEARLAAEKEGGVLVYHNQNGYFELEPDAPGIIGNAPGPENATAREKTKKIVDFRLELASKLTKKKITDIDFQVATEIRWDQHDVKIRQGCEGHFKNLFTASCYSDITNNGIKFFVPFKRLSLNDASSGKEKNRRRRSLSN